MSGLGGTGPLYLSAAARQPAIAKAKAIFERIVNLFSRFCVPLCWQGNSGTRHSAIDFPFNVVRTAPLRLGPVPTSAHSNPRTRQRSSQLLINDFKLAISQ